MNINKDEFVEDCLKGMTLEQLSKKYNCGHATISRKKNEFGIAKENPRTKCPKCNQMISNCNFQKHLISCVKDKKHLIDIDIDVDKDNDKYLKCPYCGKQFSKKGIHTHIWRMHTEEGKLHNIKINNPNNKRIAWNKGLTKETSEIIMNSSKKKVGKYKGEKSHWYGKKHSQDSITKFKQNCGGYRPGSGRGKQGWYKGYWCDSSWELAYLIYNLEHNIEITRNKQSFEYTYNNEKHKYIPDFVLSDGIYVEIKGYETEQSKAKIEQFPYNILLISGKKQIKSYLDYAISKYGKDFIKLYDKVD